MQTDVNRIRNSSLTAGPRPATPPRHWDWLTRSMNRVQWQPVVASNGDLGGMQVVCAATPADGLWRQRIRLKANEYYRVEALVSADCPADSPGGVVLEVRALDARERELMRYTSAPLRQARRQVLRGYMQTPPGAIFADVCVGLRNARGTATIHDVRFLQVVEPDANGHPSAVPPPAYAVPAPVRVQRVGVVTSTPTRPLVARLKTYFGEENVRTAGPKAAKSLLADCDALLFVDPQPPAGCASLRDLLRLAESRIVVIGLPAMAALAGEDLAYRTIEQPDDPLHARLAYACYATVGFALHDIFPYSLGSRDDAVLAQRQFRNVPAVREFCTRHGFHVFLEAETNQERTSDKPMALVRPGERGALFVLDLEPVESRPSTLNEPDLALHLLLGILGAPPPVLGQYIASPRSAEEMFGHIRDVLERFSELYWVDGEKPKDPTAPYLVGLGRDLPGVGLTLPPRPVVFIRTALTGEDINGPYAVLHYFRQLLRPPPFANPYAKAVVSRMRFAWMPLAAPLTPWGGWSPSAPPAPYELEMDFERGSVAAAVDVASHGGRGVKLICDERGRHFERWHEALPALAEAVLAGRHAAMSDMLGVPIRAGSRTRGRLLQVEENPKAFGERWHAAARSAGAALLRIELPATTSEAATQSICLTDYAAVLLELAVGLLYGLIVPNRDYRPLTLTLPASLAPLRSRLVLRPFSEPGTELPVRVDARGRVTIPPGQVLMASR